MARNERFLGKLLMQIALAALLFIGGISIFNGGFNIGGFNELGAQTIQNFFDGNVEKVALYILAGIEIVAGILLILKIFARSINQVADIFLLVVALVFVVGIVMIDIIGANWGTGSIWNQLYPLAKDVLVLSTMLVVTGRGSQL